MLSLGLQTTLLQSRASTKSQSWCVTPFSCCARTSWLLAQARACATPPCTRLKPNALYNAAGSDAPTRPRVCFWLQNPCWKSGAPRAFTPPVAFCPPEVGQAAVLASEVDSPAAQQLDLLCSRGATDSIYLRAVASPVSLAWSPVHGAAARGGCTLAVLGSDSRLRLYEPPAGVDAAWTLVQDLTDGLVAHKRTAVWGAQVRVFL